MKPFTSSLASENPDIAAEWHPTDNGDLTPDKIAPHSNKKVWWQCPAGHSYLTTPDKRTGRGAGCPYCSGKSVLAGYNDLATKAPHLAEEWDIDRNSPLTPQSVAANSHKRVWWKCSACGHEWQATVNDRFRNRGCPVCAVSTRTEKRLKTMLKPGVNDLASQRPDLLPEWSDKNTDINPADLMINSSYKAWWKCSVCGHEWQATISNRAINQSGCPKCMRFKGTSFPEQALFYYLNKVYPLTENSYKGLFDSSKMELDIFIPEINTGIEYDGIAWHSNERSRARDKRKYQVCVKAGINLIRISEAIDSQADSCDFFVYRQDSTSRSLDDAISKALRCCGIDSADVDTERDRSRIMAQYITILKGKSIAEKYPDAVKEWDTEKNGGITADMVNSTSNRVYWWKCEKGHAYRSSPANKLPYNYGCPYCSNHQLLPGFNDLETEYPELAKEWDYEKNDPVKPSDIISGTRRKYWWICPHGHSYSAQPNNRVRGKTGCPVCSNQQVLKGYNDLASTHPEIAAMWDSEKNNDLSPESVTAGSNKKAWWICVHGHSFQKQIAQYVKHPICPVCSKR